MNTYGRFPLALAKGNGCWVKDTQGRRYLDAVAGIATCTLGHSDRAMQRALRKQLGRLQHVSNLYWIPEQDCLLYTSPSPRDVEESRMPSSA